MNKFDEKYIIRLAKKDDIATIMQFIGTYWRENHILSKDLVLFEHEFLDGENVNFVLAIDKETHLLEGIIGYLKASNTETSDIWGSIWKVKDGNMPFLGVELIRRLYTLTNCRMEVGLGVNPKTATPLLKRFFHNKVEKMNHYYMLNTAMKEYKVAKVNTLIANSSQPTLATPAVKEIYAFDEVNMKIFDHVDKKPTKDAWYLNRRFFDYPYVHYKKYAVELNGDHALLIMKEVECNGSKVLRIVDYYGQRKLLAHLKAFFEELLQQCHYEYVDLYTYGFELQYIQQGGFVENIDQINIIPNYFEPFVQQNVDIWINYPSQFEGDVIFFKADADQDRPNKI